MIRRPWARVLVFVSVTAAVFAVSMVVGAAVGTPPEAPEDHGGTHDEP